MVTRMRYVRASPPVLRIARIDNLLHDRIENRIAEKFCVTHYERIANK